MKRFQTLHLALLLGSLLLQCTILPCQVKANPIVTQSFGTGGSFCFLTNISMPSAKVNITIISDSIKIYEDGKSLFQHNVSITGEYIISSPVSQNVTIAFVYPGDWNYGNQISTHEPQMQIYMDDVYLDYELVWYQDLPLDTSTYNKWDWMKNHLFALFNVSQQAGSNSKLNVLAKTAIRTDTDIFYFSYCVGTARAWQGSTLERIQIEALDYYGFIERNYEPAEYLSIAEQNDWLVGTWDLNISEVEWNHVSYKCFQQQWPYSKPINGSIMAMVVIAGVSIVLVIGIYLLKIRRSG